MASAVFFEEKQINAPWMGWTAVFVAIGLLVFVLIKLTERWHNTGSVAELIAASLGVVLIGGTIAWLAFTHSLVVTIDRGGINYVFIPSFYESKRIQATDVESFELRRLKPWEAVEAAHDAKKAGKKNPKKEVCVVNGWMVAELRLKDGRQVVLGTRNPDGMLWALKRLQNQV